MPCKRHLLEWPTIFGRCGVYVGFSRAEKVATLSLAGIYSLRMLGLFMLLPVFSIYAAQTYPDTTPFLIGLAVGVYGLGQSLLQIPFGLASDRFGRKPVIYAGLTLFALGGVVSALAHSIYGVVLGRALQGAGAIAAVCMALLADLTLEENRTKAMAAIGMSIGISFMLAIVLGPLLTEQFGLPGVFGLTAVLAVLGILLCFVWVPTPVTAYKQYDALPALDQFRHVLANIQLLRLNFSIFVLHLVLTAFFVALPPLLKQYGGLEGRAHAYVYLPEMLLSFVAMLPLIILAEKKQKIKTVFQWAIAILLMSMVLLSFDYARFASQLLALFLFFFAFNLLEALLPSLVSKMAPAGSRGTAMGLYSTGQFVGAFCGGLLGGWLSGVWGTQAVFLCLSALILLWFWVAYGMEPPRFLQNQVLRLSASNEKGTHQGVLEALLRIKGVEEAVIIEEESVAYLKVDKSALDEAALAQFALVKQA